MTSKEIDDLARAGQPLPPGQNIVTKGLYYELCTIYQRYKDGVLPVDGAKIEKKTAIQAFEKYKIQHDIVLGINDFSQKMSPIVSRINKGEGCELCRKIAEIYDRQG